MLRRDNAKLRAENRYLAAAMQQLRELATARNNLRPAAIRPVLIGEALQQ